MSSREPPRPKLRLAAMTPGVVILGAAADGFAQNECLVKVMGSRGDVANNSTICGAQNKACIFQLQLCLNEGEAGCTPAPMKKKVKPKGHCGRAGKLEALPGAARTWSFRQRSRSGPAEADRFAGAGSNAEVL